VALPTLQLFQLSLQLKIKLQQLYLNQLLSEHPKRPFNISEINAVHHEPFNIPSEILVLNFAAESVPFMIL
jgi:hypothetical protein